MISVQNRGLTGKCIFNAFFSLLIDFISYIRELSIVDAGIGCAIWDAAIISSRLLQSC